MPPTETTSPAKPATYPAQLPMQYTFVVQEVRPHMRAAEDGSSAVDDNAFDIIISSEMPRSTYGIVEVLGHKKSEVDLSFAKNGLSLLLEHGGRTSYDVRPVDPNLHVGWVDEIQTRDARLEGVMHFDSSPMGQLAKLKWKEGSYRFISAGYKPLQVKQTRAAKSFEEISEYRVTLWQPREVTITSVPADPTTGNRSAAAETFSVDVRALAPAQEEPSMPPIDAPTTTPPAAPAAPAPAPAPAAIETRSLGEALTGRNKEAAEIYRLCDSHGLAARAAEFIEKGYTLLQAKSELLDSLSKPGARQPAAEHLDGLSPKDRRRYSFQRALQLQLEGRAFDGVEGEVHKHLVGVKPVQMQQQGGIFVPLDLRSAEEIEVAEERRLGMRTMDSQTAGKGLELVAEARGQLIELLQANSVLTRLGATMLSGLTSPISFPRETGAPTVNFIGENPAADAAEDDAATGEIMCTPKSMIGAVKFSRQLLYLTSGQAEGMLRRRLAIGHDLALDRAGFHGTGAGSQPTGLYNLANVQSVAMGSATPTFVKLTDMIGLVADQNAEFGSLGFATSAIMASRLKATLEFSAAGSKAIWTGRIDDGEMGGYRAIGSTQVRRNLGAGADEHGLAFGNWAFSVIGLFGAVEILVDPYTGALRGLVKFRSYSMGDVIFQQPQAFCVATAADLT